MNLDLKNGKRKLNDNMNPKMYAIINTIFVCKQSIRFHSIHLLSDCESYDRRKIKKYQANSLKDSGSML